MLKNLATISAFILPFSVALAQSTEHPKYMDHAIIKHGTSGATVVANYSVPLFQAISAIREEYGWVVNWEDAPCYSQFDTFEYVSPKRENHSNSKRCCD